MAFTGFINNDRDRRYKSKTEERLNTSSSEKKYMSSVERRILGIKEPEVAKTDRGTIDRVLGTIGNNSIVEAMYNATDDDADTTISQGLIQGVKYMNPALDDVSNRHSFSDVLKNLGWEDEDPEKLSLSDVGRGVVGFVGDVMLDPITYINPFSAAAKVVKGSGVTMEGIKQLQRAGVISDVSDLTRGTVGANKLEKLSNLTFKDARDIIASNKMNAGKTDEEIDALTKDFMNRYAERIEKLRNADEGDGLTLGLNFASKKKSGDKINRFLTKELVSSNKLRRLGDNTIAPAYNSLAKKLRVSNIGQKFSKLNQTEAIASINGGKNAFERFYTEELLKAYDKLPLDLDDMKNAEYIQNWWNDLTENQKYDWLINYENGNFDAANSFLKFKGRIIDKYAESVSGADDLFNPINGAPSKAEERFAHAEKLMRKFLDNQTASLKSSEKARIKEFFGKDVEFMDDRELVSALRFTQRMTASSMIDMMNYYNRNMSQFSSIKGKLTDFTDKKTAMEAFQKLNPDVKQRLMNEFYTGKSAIEERAASLEGLFNDMFEDTDQAAFYERMSNLFEGDYIHDVAYLGSELRRLIKGAELDRTGQIADSKSHEIADLISKRMDEAAQKEVERGLLTQAQADKLKGRYLYHLTKEEKDKLNSLLHEDQNGQFNPDILGIMKDFDHRREAKSIADVNLKKDENGNILRDADGNYLFERKLLEDALHEIYLTRTLASNKLVYGTDVQNFIKSNFGKVLKEGEEVDIGYTAVASYKDLQMGLRRVAEKNWKQRMQSAIDNEPNEALHKSIKNTFLTNKDSIVNEEYKTLLDTFANGDPDWKIQFSPNVSMQKLTPDQIEMARRLGIEPFQIQSSILDRTNVLSRTQKVEMANSMLNLFDRMQNIWKLQNTIVNPGFHIQNLVSNMFQSFLGIGSDAINPRKLRTAYHVLMTRDPRQTITLGGKKYTYKELEHIAKKTGVIDELFHKYEFSYGGKAGKLEKLGVPPSLDPTNIDDFFAYKVGTTIGTRIEATQRLNLFMSALDQGMDIPDAVNAVNKFLFDYGELTEFEQETMKRIVPFYTFMKKNIPMELQQMLEQPTTFTSIQRAMNEISQMSGENYQNENERNEWRQDSVQIPAQIDGKNFGVQNVLPYTQLDRIAPRKLLGQTTPFFKIPVELATGETIYTEMPIDSKGQYFANQIIAPKIFNMAQKKDEGMEKRLYILGQLLGIPINEMTQLYDYSNTK